MTQLLPVCPTSIPPRIGRERIYRTMLDSLTKAAPQSLSLVGPRFSGKSVLLKALEQDAELRRKFCCVVYWNLGHNMPVNDDEFIVQMARELGVALKGIDEELSEYLLMEGAGYDQLVEVMESLEANGKRVLMLWDAIDRSIESGSFTRNLWDNLLALSRKESLWLVSASRKKLQTLIRDRASVTSEFWLIFEVMILKPMDEEDIQALLQTAKFQSAQPGFLKEILNWTGGIPPLVASLLNQLIHSHQKTLAPDQLREAAANLDERCKGIVETIWEDCSDPAKDLYEHLCVRGAQLLANLPKQGREQLIFAGMAKQEKNQFIPTCRVLQEQVVGASPATGAMALLFGRYEDYRKNIRGMLERRLAQIDRFDDRLIHLIEGSLRGLPEYPDLCLANLSHIEDQAFEVIWAKEFGGTRQIPQCLISAWTGRSKDLPRPIQEMMNEDNWRIKDDRSHQLAVLQLITGSHHFFTDSTAEFASKDAYVLLNAIHCFRNRSQHTGGQDVLFGTAVAGVFLCIELAAALSRFGPAQESAKP